MLLLLVVLVGMFAMVGCASNDAQEAEQPETAVESEDPANPVVESEVPADEETPPSEEASSGAEFASGKPAPDFTLKNLAGQDVSLSDYRGKIVLINFWATWCVYCDMEMPDLQKLDDENEDLVVLAVDVMEDKETVEEYINEGGYNFEVVLDEDGSISQTYLVSGYPTSYFVDSEGILLGGVPGMMTYEQMNQILNDIR